MSKYFLSLLVLIALGYPAPAQPAGTRDHTFLFGTSIGWLAGEGEEIVYKGLNSDNKLSQLLWKMSPLFYTGLDVNYKWQKPENKWGVFASALFKYGIPSETGKMEDRDWIYLNYPDFLTHYSVHDNRTEGAILFDADIGVSFNIYGSFLFKTYVSYNFMHFSWTANGGSILHPPWDTDGDGFIDGIHAYLPPIDVVEYEQNWHTLSPAIAFYGEFNQYFDIEIYLELSPLIWFSGKDNHISQNLIITSDLRGGFFIEPGLLFSFRPGKLLTASLSVAYRNIRRTRGNSNYNDRARMQISNFDIGGAGYSAFDIGIMAKFGIFR